MTHWRNFERFAQDGFLFAKNFREQPQWSISFANINDRRGEEYTTPCGQSLHNFVPFYFSPCTAMSYSIMQGNVDLANPEQIVVKKADCDDVAYIVCNTQTFDGIDRQVYFTNVAANTRSPMPAYLSDLRILDTHIDWSVFDEAPYKAKIPEIGYNGVCQWQHNRTGQERLFFRKAKRMAEFMVKDWISLQEIVCIVTNNEQVQREIQGTLGRAGIAIPVYCKPDCYY